MSAPLTNGQKAYLAQLSDRAFRFEGAKARGRGEQWPPVELVGRDSVEPSKDQGSTESHPTVSESEILRRWRHDAVVKACGKLGLRCCSQDDYKLVEAHFLNVLNEPGKAFKAHVRAQGNDERIAEWKLMQAIKEAEPCGINRAYAEAICKRQYGCTIIEASAKQKWNLMFTIKNRASAKRKEQSA